MPAAVSVSKVEHPREEEVAKVSHFCAFHSRKTKVRLISSTTSSTSSSQCLALSWDLHHSTRRVAQRPGSSG